MLFLTEDDVRRVLTMEMAIEGVEAGLRKVALDEAVNIPRTRCQTDHIMLHVLSASAKSLGLAGHKAYTTGKRGARFWVTLYDGKTGAMIALMQADYLGQMRTGAASAVATRLLARPDAATVGMLGTGAQARTQLLGVCQVRPIKQARVFSRDPAKRAEFARRMTEEAGIEVVASESAETAVRGADIVITATTSRDPVFFGDWLSPGMHLNVIGSNFRTKAEIDLETVRRAQLVVIDSKEQGKVEAGDLLAALDADILQWTDIPELGQLIIGRYPGRESPEDVTLFCSLGLGIEDVAVGARVLAKARELGIGQQIELNPNTAPTTN